MSQRERWIVYPLLFFSFALAIRDQWPSPTTETNLRVVNCDVLTCGLMIVKDANGSAAVDIQATPDGNAVGSGRINIYGSVPKTGVAKLPAVRMYVRQQQNAAGKRSDFGVVETMGPLGSPATRLISDDSGGIVATYDSHGKPVLALTSPRNRSQTQPPQGDTEDPRQAAPRPPVPSEGKTPTEADSEA